MAMALRVVVPPHPLLAHWLTVLRERQTPQPLVCTALAELGRWLSYEALRDWLPQRQVAVETSAGACDGLVVDAAIPLLAISALPAGGGLWQGAQGVLPAAQIGHVVVDDAAIVQRCWPDPIAANTGVLLFWGQLAAPEPLLAVLDQLAALGVSGTRLRVITAVAAAPALQSIGESHGALTLYTAAIDPDLDEQGRISPGLGELDSRLIGYSHSH
ncbi:MAG: uracil phosphoribosyltransferase [Cyanobacteriota bacterium]|nr:uracil phosphoribosyltransferase [Cyanobacteriota bacterium]